MINVNMTDKAGVTLATAGKYCADNVKVTPSAEILRKDEQAKTATPTTSAQDITPDAGKALSKVTVNPITAAIVGDLDADSFTPAIVAAVEGKGVTVPSGTLLDGMASLIESIEAGGGAAKYSYGSFTPSETTALTSAYAIEHNSGFVPDVFIVAKSKSTYVQYSIRFAASFPHSLFTGKAIDYSSYTGYVFGWGSANYNSNVGIVSIGKEITSTVAYIRSNAQNNKVVAGETYQWFAIGGL